MEEGQSHRRRKCFLDVNDRGDRTAVEFNIAKHYEIIVESPTAPVDEAEQEDTSEPEEPVYSLDGDDD